MTAEQRKWYAMGANDMEAGRLVAKVVYPEHPLTVPGDDPLGEVESLREQLGGEREQWERAAKGWEGRIESLREQLTQQEVTIGLQLGWKERAEAVEAKLAEVRQLLSKKADAHAQAEFRAQDLRGLLMDLWADDSVRAAVGQGSPLYERVEPYQLRIERERK